jgi:hypothetical protein
MFLNSFGARRLRLEGEDAARFPHPPRRMQGRHPDVGASVNKGIARLEHRVERQLVLQVIIAAEEINASFPVVAQVEFQQVAMYFPRIVRFGAARQRGFTLSMPPMPSRSTSFPQLRKLSHELGPKQKGEPRIIHAVHSRSEEEHDS